MSPLSFRRPVVLQLAADEILPIDNDVWLRVTAGRVWITRHGDADDHFLVADQGVMLRRADRALVSGEAGGASVALDGGPGWSGLLRALGARLAERLGPQWPRRRRGPRGLAGA